MLQRVIREVAGADLAQLAQVFGPDDHASGDDGGVLNEFLVILGADTTDGAGDGGLETGNDFFLQYPTCLGGHINPFSGVVDGNEKSPALKSAGD